MMIYKHENYSPPLLNSTTITLMVQLSLLIAHLFVDDIGLAQ